MSVFHRCDRCGEDGINPLHVHKIEAPSARNLMSMHDLCDDCLRALHCFLWGPQAGEAVGVFLRQTAVCEYIPKSGWRYWCT